MATQFTRLTVFADERNIDVSLPADRPILELLPQLRDLLSLNPQTTGRWGLSTVSAGTLDPRRSLREVGVVDADVLYLTSPREVPLPPVLDDVVDEVQSILDNDGSEWVGDARRYGSAALAGVMVVVLALAVPFSSLSAVGMVNLLVDIAVSAVIVGWLLRVRGGEFVIGASALPWTLSGIAAARLVVGSTGADAVTAQVAAGLVGLGLGGVLLGLASGRFQGVGAAGFALLPFGLLGMGLVAAGLDASQVAAALVIPVAFAAGVAPQVALSRSRLVRLLRADETGEATARSELAVVVRRGQSTLTGAVAGIAVVATLVVVMLISAGTVFAVVLGLALGIVFALRSRAFTRTGQVLPMLAPVAVAAAVAVIAAPSALGATPAVAASTTFGAPILLLLVVVFASRARLGDVGAARLRQFFDLVELIAVLSLVPLAIAVVGGFGWAAG